MTRGPRRWGRVGCALEIMLATLFALLHAAAAWRVSAWWPGVTALPPSAPARLIFTAYWWPPMRLLDWLGGELGAPTRRDHGLMLLPLGWLTCFVYGWLTALAVCLPHATRLNRRR